jgi:hypothetical protein
MSKSSMPVSKAKNAYELLGEIRDLILEEPKRYNQGAWKEWMRRVDEDKRPACGTTACVAGWVDTLKSKRPVRAYDIWRSGGGDKVKKNAICVLGITDRQARYLFGATAVDSRHVVGVEEHARSGAAHIARFMKRHLKQLKAKRV